MLAFAPLSFEEVIFPFEGGNLLLQLSYELQNLLLFERHSSFEFTELANADAVGQVSRWLAPEALGPSEYTAVSARQLSKRRTILVRRRRRHNV